MPRASSCASLPRVLRAMNARTPVPQSSRLTRAVPQLSPSVPPSFQVPHKIFVWDPNGVYLKVCFLNPVYGHFIEPNSLIGARIGDVLSRASSQTLGSVLVGVWKSQALETVQLPFHRDGCDFQATVYCSPLGEEEVLGMVIDGLKGTDISPSAAVAGSPVSWPLSRMKHLTLREQTVFAGLGLQASTRLKTKSQGHDESETLYVRNGLSNKELAEELDISIRTVKEHVTHIYKKLRIVSRHHRHPPK